MSIVLAGALVTGGATYSPAGADIPYSNKANPPDHASNAAKHGPSEAPLLAPATVAPRTAAPVAAPAPAPTRPLKPPRRDLAGFLSERGLSITPTSEEAGAAPKPDDASAPPPTVTAAPEPVLALAEPSGATPRESANDAPIANAQPMTAQAAVDAPAPANAISQTFPTVSVRGAELGAVTMRGDKVHLASLVGLLELKMPAAEFARLKSAPAADSFVDLDTLRAAGVAVTLDPTGERMTLATA